MTTDKIWLSAYPQGVPAEIQPDTYSSLTALLEESFHRYADRDAYWTSREEVVGKVVEVRADAITQNQDGSYSLRFPRFVRFRDDK